MDEGLVSGSSSGVQKKDGGCLVGVYEMWLARERSWLRVRPNILSDNFFERLVEKVNGRVCCGMVLLEREIEM